MIGESRLACKFILIKVLCVFIVINNPIISITAGNEFLLRIRLRLFAHHRYWLYVYNRLCADFMFFFVVTFVWPTKKIIDVINSLIISTIGYGSMLAHYWLGFSHGFQRLCTLFKIKSFIMMFSCLLEKGIATKHSHMYVT